MRVCTNVVVKVVMDILSKDMEMIFEFSMFLEPTTLSSPNLNLNLNLNPNPASILHITY